MHSRFVMHDTHAAAIDPPRWLGGKAQNLVRLCRLGQRVPDFYVVTADAFHTALAGQSPVGRYSELIERLCSNHAGDAAQAAEDLRRMICQLVWPTEVAQSIKQAYTERFSDNARIAVRSSAIGEDSSAHSFGGMYDSVLDVSGIDAVLEAIKQVWESAFGERALAYRTYHGLPLNQIAMAVIVQRMIAARQSGVLFTCDPRTRASETIVIEAVTGTGAKLVQGDANATTYCRPKDSSPAAPAEVDPRHNPHQFCATATQHVSSEISSNGRQSVLTEQQIDELCRCGKLIEQQFEAHQDIEFCFDSAGGLWVLQARPLSGCDSNHTAANHLIWDNSNIIESYSGITTPLTFSFIRRAYGIVYRCFAQVMGISPQAVQDQCATFDNMLGFFRGRVYYNLKNWYRLVRLFPGYRYNKAFMESMMGLKEPLPIEDDAPQPGALRRWLVELPALVWLISRIVWKFARINSIVRRFRERFDRHYEQWRRIDFGSLSPHELLSLYRQMEQALLWNWRAPIINDFYVMVFYGVLQKLCVRWRLDSSGSLQNGLLCGIGGVESAEPARRLLHLARRANESEELRELICQEPLLTLPRRVADDPRFVEFQKLLDDYLDAYGLRCADELKLEERSHRECPERVYQLIRNYLLLDSRAVLDEETHQVRERETLRSTERQVDEALSRHGRRLFRKPLFHWLLRQARVGIRNRENLRFARTKIYGIARAMFRAMGHRFARCGVLERADDVFYLTVDEIWNYVEGTAVSADLRGIVTARREEYDRYRSSATPPPDNRFETFGLPYFGNDFRRPVDGRNGVAKPMLRGLGCCPGVVEGVVQILHDPTADGGITGEILVTLRTDPGWTPLFPAFRGMLVERGSMLSHSAIVAREMGIPTIVAISGLLDRLRSGQRVRMDGTAGTVEILSRSTANLTPAPRPPENCDKRTPDHDHAIPATAH
jgi:phosphoenolpyruvate synthase/pyruvate phosphate dikinase